MTPLASDQGFEVSIEFMIIEGEKKHNPSLAQGRRMQSSAIRVIRGIWHG
jgi:hypothetical protein